MLERSRAWIARHFGGLVLVALVIVYLPGLGGGFLFDDYGTLAVLDAVGHLRTWEDRVRYLLSGFAGPTGRPLSMMSFLIDAHGWPQHPEVFKRTNLALHLANAWLLAILIRRLAAAMGGDAARARRTAWLAAALWALHPLWVSTTLYVVQRMTLLSTLLTFSGLIVYLAGRHRFAAGQSSRGAWLGLGGLGLFTAAATLAKENGALLPLLALALERYALPALTTHGARAWKAALVFASLPVFVVLGRELPDFFTTAVGRTYSPWERLLTEGRVLWHDLALLWLPRIHSDGLYGTEWTISRGLFHPPVTALAWVALALLVFLAEGQRRRRPWLAVAPMFFLTGHLLESTWLPLEISFEHRNYLPAALAFLPVAHLATREPAPAKRAIAAILLVFLGAQTALRADLWSRPFSLALSWAERHPTESRAQAHLASLWLETGNVEEALRLIDRAARAHPDDLLLAANGLLAECHRGAPSLKRVQVFARALQRADLRAAVPRAQVERVLEALMDEGCAGQAYFPALWQLAYRHPGGDGVFRAKLLTLRATFGLRAGDAVSARKDLDAAAALFPHPGAVLASAALLASFGHHAAALDFLDRAPPAPPARLAPHVDALREWWLARTGYWQREKAALREVIARDAASAGREIAPTPNR